MGDFTRSLQFLSQRQPKPPAGNPMRNPMNEPVNYGPPSYITQMPNAPMPELEWEKMKKLGYNDDGTLRPWPGYPQGLQKPQTVLGPDGQPLDFHGVPAFTFPGAWGGQPAIDSIISRFFRPPAQQGNPLGGMPEPPGPGWSPPHQPGG